mmetsp:Transcript_40220/g.87928  ORF Transcript_40220/g.87928 Transcript_40220/m.87928 type:complete len:957 (-) Transcript_40220:68-2938(-)
MSLSLALLAGHLVDYAAKMALLVCLGRESSHRAHFAAMAAAHVAVNLHGACSYCSCVGRLPRCLAPFLALLLGVATPLMQVLHLLDGATAWWCSQASVPEDTGRQLLPRRLAPIDAVFEGLVFACAAVHLRVGLLLGDSLPLRNVSNATFEALLALALATSLLNVAAGIVIWDSTVSLKLSEEMYGQTGLSGGLRGGGRFLVHLLYRGTEVTGRVALLAALAAVLRPGDMAGYLAVGGFANCAALLFASPPVGTDEASVLQHWGAAGVLAWPLLFVNLAQFVDSPKHISGAQSAAGLLCGARALELAVALCAAVAAILLEVEAAATSASLSTQASGGGGGDVETVLGGAVHAVRAWRTLYQRNATRCCLLCLLAHYLYNVVRWCGPDFSDESGLPRRQSEYQPSGGPFGVGSRGGGASAAGDASLEEKFWPPARGLAPLLLAAACERSPPAFSIAGVLPCSTVSGTGLRRPGQAQRQLRVEDFDIVRLIGCGEFGKVFQVTRRGTQEVFAMKRLSKEFYARRRMTDKAGREMETLGLASGHPFVVRLVHTVENARDWGLVMEYCPQGDLQQLLLSDGCPGLPLDRTLRIAAEVALALEHLHSRGIVFRDLKLENVVLDHDGHAKLADFGLAKSHGGGYDAVVEAEANGGVYASFTKTFCGSYGYVAPEVNPRRQVHGFAADMYSLGVLLLMLLTGGQVYHDTRQPPWERRLPPETPKDLFAMLGVVGFEFYWTTHCLLKPAGAVHRLEVNLNGEVIIHPRGLRGSSRRHHCPQRPPASPRGRSAAGSGPVPGGGSDRFPASARMGSEAAQRQWTLALDLVRVLTDEQPENRGTVAKLKQHGFFAQDIRDWRTVLPRSWLLHRLEGQLRDLSGAVLPTTTQWLQEQSIEELASYQDSPSSQAELLARLAAAGTASAAEQPSSSGAQADSTASGIGGLEMESSEAAHDWVAHYYAASV